MDDRLLLIHFLSQLGLASEITFFHSGYATNLIANEAIRIIKNKDKNKPLFL